MPRAPAFTPKEPVEKLPLAVRKDIRDKFDSVKEEFQSQVEEQLGTPFTINFNPNEVLAYNPEGSSYTGGSILKNYAEGFVKAVKKHVEQYGEDGKTMFNEVVTKAEVTLAVNTLGDKADTISCDVQDGVFRILFKHDCLNYNTSCVDDYLLKAIEAVPREGLSLSAKHSIDEYWKEEIDDLTAEVAEILNMPDVVLDPNFEENYAMLKKNKKDDKEWERNFGKVLYQYFKEGLKYQLTSQGFTGDDMLQEGIAEIVTSKTFKVRVVEKTKKDATNETIIEDGVVYMQCTADKWWYNTSDMGQGLVDKL